MNGSQPQLSHSRIIHTGTAESDFFTTVSKFWCAGVMLNLTPNGVHQKLVQSICAVASTFWHRVVCLKIPVVSSPCVRQQVCLLENNWLQIKNKDFFKRVKPTTLLMFRRKTEHKNPHPHTRKKETKKKLWATLHLEKGTVQKESAKPQKVLAIPQLVLFLSPIRLVGGSQHANSKADK